MNKPQVNIEMQKLNPMNSSELKKIISDFLESRNKENIRNPGINLQSILTSNMVIKVIESRGQTINKLSGTCAQYTSEICGYLNDIGIIVNYIRGGTLFHAFLLIRTYSRNKDDIIIDATLGQFIEYPDIFIGTYDELKKTFCDESKRLLICKLPCTFQDYSSMNGKFIKINTREELFDFIYNYQGFINEKTKELKTFGKEFPQIYNGVINFI
nr:hypothetical protein [Candidatus Gracilibacteria bacterium]